MRGQFIHTQLDLIIHWMPNVPDCNLTRVISLSNGIFFIFIFLYNQNAPNCDFAVYSNGLIYFWINVVTASNNTNPNIWLKFTLKKTVLEPPHFHHHVSTKKLEEKTTKQKTKKQTVRKFTYPSIPKANHFYIFQHVIIHLVAYTDEIERK